MSRNADEDQVKDSLEQLRCHFTWKLHIDDTELPDLGSRVFDQIEFLDTKYSAGIYNLQAYVKHLTGQNEGALESLKEAEKLNQQEHAGQSDVRRLVTWGNYAWLYYHMGRLAEAQTYLNKVENMCKKFGSPSRYTVECPDLDCDEGWALLKCGGKNYERAKACFEKALEVDPENPEFNTGYAIVLCRRDGFKRTAWISDPSCLLALKRAVRLSPDDAYIKALLALKLQDVGQEAEGEKYLEEALKNMSSQTYVYRYAGKFYRKKGSTDKALELFKMALKATPSSAFLHHQMGLCYRAQVFKRKQASNWQHRGWSNKSIDRITKLAISHFEFAVERKPTFAVAYIHLADMYIEAGDYRKAEDAYQRVLRMESLEEENLQDLYCCYGRFQEFHKKAEVDAMISYLKAIKIEKPSYARDRSITSLEKLALKKLRRNSSDMESLSILGFTYRLRGEINKALECYERALGLAADLEDFAGCAP